MKTAVRPFLPLARRASNSSAASRASAISQSQERGYRTHRDGDDPCDLDPRLTKVIVSQFCAWAWAISGRRSAHFFHPRVGVRFAEPLHPSATALGWAEGHLRPPVASVALRVPAVHQQRDE